MDIINFTFIFTADDIKAMAQEAGIDETTAIERAQEWSAAIEDHANETIVQRLTSVIRHDTP